MYSSLDELFVKWKQEHYPDTRFYMDGIIDEELYKLAKTKVLYIAKEPNGSNHEHLPYSDFREEWKNEMPKYEFARRLGEWTYGILNSFPAFDLASRKTDYLRYVAFMNIKKSGGGGTANHMEIQEALTTQINYILAEIELINPDIIVLCTGRSKALSDILFTEGAWSQSGYGIEYKNCKSRTIIDFYHPTARNVAAASYSLLQNVIRSIPPINVTNR